MRTVVLVMGVSASGKSTLGQGLADRMGAIFVEGDELHPEANVAKMSRGEPLTDADRWPWLDRIVEVVAKERAVRPTIFACSALKRSYRDRLRDGLPALRIVYPDISRPLAEQRISGRSGHFMPATLIDSQFATLEVPGHDEKVIRVDATQTPERIIAAAAAKLGL